jgi:tRNA(Ile)-lysidine synthase
MIKAFPEGSGLAEGFAAAMAAAGPFEPRVELAVAVSGGCDSMALALLADRWVRARGGAVTAFTVDHRLRAGSRREALWVHRVLGARGIRHHILSWRQGAVAGRANLQAEARTARYQLLEERCRAKGILHLLVAHHLDDQAETFLMRLERGSGLYGLAAMAPVVERKGVRLLRPFLTVPKDNLRAYLEGCAQDWLEDPSNQDTGFARVRTRRAMPALSEVGVTPERIAGTTGRLGRDRVVMDQAVARLLALAAAPDPAGFVHLDRDQLLAAPEPLGLRALSRVLAVVGGAAYGPRFERLARLYHEIAGSCRARTLGGCTIRRARSGTLLICREPAAQGPPMTLSGPGTVLWDGRFRIELTAEIGGPKRASLTLGPLGGDGWARIKTDAAGFAGIARGRLRALPGVVKLGLPALSDRRGVVEVPHLGYRRPGGGIASLKVKSVSPLPPEPLAGAVFCAAGMKSPV